MNGLSRRLIRAAGQEQRARSVKRAFEPAATTRDRRDHDHLRAVLAALLGPADHCVDAGANVGDVLRDIVRLAPAGRHHAFEPLPELAAGLRAAFPAVEVHEAALGAQEGRADFVRVVDTPGWSGLRVRPFTGDRPVEHIDVALTTLDAALPPDLVPALIKIDVEGAELDVLRGARRLLAHRPALVFEHGLGSADVYGTRPQDVHALLTGHGYRIFDLDGDGPYAEPAFVATFHAARRVNFLARA